MATSSKNMIIWGVVYLILILSLITPLGLVTINLMMIPLVLMFVMFDTKKFIMIYAVILVILYAVLGSGGGFLGLTTLMFLAPSIAMGIQYRKQATPGAVLTAGISAFIVVLLLLLLLFSALGVNITEEFSSILKSDESFTSMINTIVQNETQLDSFIDLMISMIPMMIIIISVYYTLITHWLGRKLLTRVWQPVPKLKPMREWKLPRSMVWYYLIILVLDLILVIDTGSVISVIVLNSLPLLTYAFAIQAVGFLFFVSDMKGWNRALPIAGILMLPFIPNLLAWLGIIDIAFNLRKWASEKAGKNVE